MTKRREFSKAIKVAVVKRTTRDCVTFLHECFSLDYATGQLQWRVRSRDHFPSKRAWAIWNARYAGKMAGSRDKRGYVCVSISGTKMWAHRIVYQLAYGDLLATDLVDHVDNDKSNNRPVNLRKASPSQNICNGKARATNKTGLKGVHKNGNKFSAQITVRGLTKHLGTFATPEDAHEAYKVAAVKAHGSFARFR